MGDLIELPGRHHLATASEVLRPYRPHPCSKGEISIIAEHFDFSKATAAEVAATCMELDAINHALKVSALAHGKNAESKPRDVSVYIIANESGTASKLGMAKRPDKRVQELQVGSWEPLSVVSLMWCIDGRADWLEFAAQNALTEAGVKRRGEWFRASPATLAGAVASAAAALNIKIADSSMWLRQREAVRQTLSRIDKSLPSWSGMARMKKYVACRTGAWY